MSGRVFARHTSTEVVPRAVTIARPQTDIEDGRCCFPVQRTLHMTQKIVFSGIQPTGELHIGNYFGAVQNWARIQDGGEYKPVYCVVDLHAMTMPYDHTKLKANTETMFIELLASGLDPQKSIVFIQSLVPEHTELGWIFACVCSYGDLTRQVAFKDKSEQLDGKQEGFISAGLFTYPVLQAADILLYRAGYVPVGKDQEQHLELSRAIANRFNRTFGVTYFPEPAVLSTETPKLLSLNDPAKKMSKSLGPKSYVAMGDDEKTVRSKIRSAVTDTGEPGTEIGAGAHNLLAVLRACDRAEQADALLAEYAGGGQRRYAPLKEAAADALVTLTSGFRARKAALVADKDGVKRLIAQGADNARAVAADTIKEVRRIVGLPRR
jgi:tryptophanyl-tRNA synthetase